MAERPLETGWLADTPTDDNLLLQFLHNQAELTGLLAEALGGRSTSEDGIRLATANSPIPYYNQALLMRPILQAHDSVLDAVDDFYAGGPPATVLSVWPMPDLASRGWHLVGHPMLVVKPGDPVLTGAAEAAPPAGAKPLAPGVTVERVEDAETLAVAEAGVADWYPIEAAQSRPPGSILPPSLLAGPMPVFLGRLDGQPVSAAAVHVSHGVVNLCMAATDPAARRRGVWRALVEARRAGHEDLPTVAFTSDDSRPGFVRMGFLPILRLTMWLVS